MNVFRLSLTCLLLLSHPALRGEDKEKTIPDLVCFWDFDEAEGEARVSEGQKQYALQEVKGPIARVEGSAPGKYAARIKAGQYFSIPDGKFEAIDFHGPEAQVSVVALVRRRAVSYWQAVAGIWNETRKQRQYCLFISGGTRSDARTMKRFPTKDEVHGHVSNVGGPTEGHRYCITYSSSGTKVPQEEWTLIAMTYDGRASRAYVNGKLAAEEGYNPYPLKGGLFNGDGDFTVGAVDRGGEIGNYFNGEIDELSIYSRALTDKEMLKLAAKVEK
ncbi:MAG: sialidase domain-containing protein [Verrucomicrobiales bacterium]|nr:sialidase domain-containing protein [Verrucomicrobiales bacterium]